MTEALFRADPYLRETTATVVSASEKGVTLDRTVFYAQDGGQPGDRGALILDDGASVPIADTVYDADKTTILHAPVQGVRFPAPGASVIARIDWELRYRRMRTHTALHLLSVVLPYPVTGGAVGDGEGRLDFDAARRPSTKPASKGV